MNNNAALFNNALSLHDMELAEELKTIGVLKLEVTPTVADTYESTSIIERRMEHDAPLRLKDAIFVKQNYRYHKIRHQDILYLKADGNYTCIYTTGKTYLIKYSLQAFTSKFLDNEAFARVHRSFTINMQHISSFNETIAVIDNKEIPIGPNYRSSFIKLFTS